MLTDPAAIIEDVLFQEGGEELVHDFAGGWTRYGISEKSGLSEEQIRNLTKEDAVEFYMKEYYLPLKRLPAELLHICIDSAVNMGRRQMVKLLQRASGLTGSDVDGHLGPKTYAAAQSTTAGEFREQRYLFYVQLCQDKPEYEKFKNGWIRRTMRV